MTSQEKIKKLKELNRIEEELKYNLYLRLFD